MPISLKDKTAIVAGASSGIGRAVAVALAREGVLVMAAARRDISKLLLGCPRGRVVRLYGRWSPMD